MKSQENPPKKAKRDQFVFRLKPERAAEVRRWADEHYTKVQLMVDRGLKLVMDEERAVIDGQKRLAGKHPKKEKEITSAETDLAYNLRIPEHREWVDFVVEIFNSGHVRDIAGLIRNIDAFKRGNQFDELAPLLLQLTQYLNEALKKYGTTPDASITSALQQASDLARTLARARNAIEQLESYQKGSSEVRPKRAG